MLHRNPPDCNSTKLNIFPEIPKYFQNMHFIYMRRTAGCTWTDYKTNTQITKELKITTILDKLLEYKRNWIQHVNRMPRNRLPKVMKNFFPTFGRNYGRLLKRFLDTWDRNGSTSGPTPWQIWWWWWWWWWWYISLFTTNQNFVVLLGRTSGISQRSF